MIQRIEVALNDLRQLYPANSESVGAKEEAIAAGKLVIDTKAREVYWAGDLIDQPWGRFKTAWKFLGVLAIKAQHRSLVTDRELYGSRVVSLTAMSSAFSRLKERLPTSLWKMIATGEVPRSYRLLLEPEQIYFCD